MYVCVVVVVVVVSRSDRILVYCVVCMCGVYVWCVRECMLECVWCVLCARECV